MKTIINNIYNKIYDTVKSYIIYIAELKQPNTENDYELVMYNIHKTILYIICKGHEIIHYIYNIMNNYLPGKPHLLPWSIQEWVWVVEWFWIFLIPFVIFLIIIAYYRDNMDKRSDELKKIIKISDKSKKLTVEIKKIIFFNRSVLNDIYYIFLKSKLSKLFNSKWHSKLKKWFDNNL